VTRQILNLKLAGLGIGRCSHGGAGELLSWWAVASPLITSRGATALCRRCGAVVDALITHTRWTVVTAVCYQCRGSTQSFTLCNRVIVFYWDPSLCSRVGVL